MAAGPRYMALGRTAQETPLPRVLPLLHDNNIGTGRIENPLPTVKLLGETKPLLSNGSTTFTSSKYYVITYTVT
jgi:hypothetical protein